MNIRNLLTGAAAAIAMTIGGAAIAPAPAQAQTPGPGTCIFEASPQSGGAGRRHRCTTREYIDTNGHPAIQVTWDDGMVTSYVFWPRDRDGRRYAEIFSAGTRHIGRWFDYPGSVMILHDSGAVTTIGGVSIVTR